MTEPTDLDDGALTARLLAALAAGEVDDAGVAATELAVRLGPTELTAAVVEAIVPSLAAAAHGPIFLHLLPRAAASSLPAASMFGSLAREVARNPEMALTWQTEIDDETSGEPIADAVADVPQLGVPGSSFIFPLMDQAESSGTAAELLSGAIGPDIDVAAAGRDLSRAAAWSMIQDDPAHAPYGWSHAFTMPQAVVSIAPLHPRPHEAIAVAATHLIGFRAALSTVTVKPGRVEADPLPTFDGFLANGPAIAAATALAADADRWGLIARLLANVAAVQPDAHLAKYVNACFDAARLDREQTGLYLAAAASLAAWWAQVPIEGDPILA